ncbi:MAG: hypothetical protein ACREDT_12755 [Methylocella sp.]
MVKLRAPDGISSIVHDGNEVEIADDRSVEVDDLSAGVLKAHGFLPWNHGQSAVQIDATPRSQTVLDILKGTRRTLEGRPAEEPRAGVPAAAPDTVPLPDVTETGGEQEQDISSLNRPALFAFLRANGVSVSLPITNEELRAAARRARERER